MPADSPRQFEPLPGRHEYLRAFGLPPSLVNEADPFPYSSALYYSERFAMKPIDPHYLIRSVIDDFRLPTSRRKARPIAKRWAKRRRRSSE